MAFLANFCAVVGALGMVIALVLAIGIRRGWFQIEITVPHDIDDIGA